EVVVSDPNTQRRQWAQSLGQVHVLDPAENTVAEGSIDIAFDFSGVNAGVNAAISSLDIGGRAVLAGSVAPTAQINVNPESLERNWLSITGVHNYEPHHLHQAVEFLSNSAIEWSQVISPPIGLQEIPAGGALIMNTDRDSQGTRCLRTAVAFGAEARLIRFFWAHNQTHRRTPYLIVRVPLSNGASIDKDLLRHGPVQSPFKLNGLFASVGHIVNLAQESIGSSGSHFIVAVK